VPAPPPVDNRAIAPRRGPAPGDDPSHPTRQYWQQRQAERDKQVAWVHQLAEQGLSQRAIVRRTGFNRRTVRAWLQLERPEVPEAELPDLVEPTPPPPKPGARKRAKIRHAQALAGQGLSYCEIARQLGAHRTTISKWVHQQLPEETEAVAPPAPGIDLPPPPPPWASWEQVRQIREMLQEHRFVLLKRPEHLDEEEQGHLVALLDSPVGPELQVGRDFLVDWYRIWGEETGQRRTLAEAEARYQTWQTNASYGAVPVLHRLQQRVTPAKFAQMSQFLRQSGWEATNNGAERAGRAFRHRQAPHFNLRDKETIAASMTVAACLRKEAVTALPMEPLHTCQRGRKKRTEQAIPVGG